MSAADACSCCEESAVRQCDGCQRTVCADCMWWIGDGDNVESRCVGCEDDRDERESEQADAGDGR